jgi:hypothetical protein
VTLLVGCSASNDRASEDLVDRLDAEFVSNRHREARALVGSRAHERVDAVGNLVILGRYKRYYVRLLMAHQLCPVVSFISSGRWHQRTSAIARVTIRALTV